MSDHNGVSDAVEISFYVPCLNEEGQVASTLDNICVAAEEVGCSYEAIVFDDASSDRTSEVVKQYQRDHPHRAIRLFINEHRQGISRNFVAGAFVARGIYYRTVFGDNVDPLENHLSILNNLGAADILIPYHSHIDGKPLGRRMLSWAFTKLVNLFGGFSLPYYNAGNVHLLSHVLRYHSHCYGFGFQADLVTHVLDEGASYLTIPVTGLHRGGSATTAVKMRNILSVCHSLLEILLRRVRKSLYGSVHPYSDLTESTGTAPFAKDRLTAPTPAAGKPSNADAKLIAQ